MHTHSTRLTTSVRCPQLPSHLSRLFAADVKPDGDGNDEDGKPFTTPSQPDQTDPGQLRYLPDEKPSTKLLSEAAAAGPPAKDSPVENVKEAVKDAAKEAAAALPSIAPPSEATPSLPAPQSKPEPSMTLHT